MIAIAKKMKEINTPIKEITKKSYIKSYIWS
jgi:hypothetical protein